MHFRQNDRDLLRATAVTLGGEVGGGGAGQGGGGCGYRNKNQHRKTDPGEK